MALLKMVKKQVKSVAGMKKSLIYTTKKSSMMEVINLEKRNVNHILNSMINTQKMFSKFERENKKRKMYHFIFSYTYDESNKLSDEMKMQIAKEVLYEIGIASDFETVLNLHKDRRHHHVHIQFNAVNFKTGKKFYYKNGDFNKIYRDKINRVLSEYGLSKIEKKTTLVSIRKLIKDDIDYYKSICTTTDELFKNLIINEGYKIKKDKNGLKLLFPGASKYVFLESLGKEYLKNNLDIFFISDVRKNYSYVSKIKRMNLDFNLLKKKNLSTAEKIQVNEIKTILKIRNGIRGKAYQKYKVKASDLYRLQDKFNKVAEVLEKGEYGKGK